MRTVNTNLVEEYAEQLRPLLPIARTAYGTQGPNSAPRIASQKVNALLVEYVDERGGNVTHLANELGTEMISLAGLRRRLRSARSGHSLGATPTSKKRGTKDPERVADAAEQIRTAKDEGTPEYGAAVRRVYNEGVSLTAVGRELGISYFALWAVATTTRDEDVKQAS